MPDIVGNGNGVQRVKVPDAPEPVKLPPTPAEVAAAKLALVSGETDGERSERRAKELRSETTIHAAAVTAIHAMYPGLPLRVNDFEKDLTPEQQKQWNERRGQIDAANRAYHLSVRRVVGDHRNEDAHIARLFANRAKAAAGEA